MLYELYSCLVTFYIDVKNTFYGKLFVPVVKILLENYIILSEWDVKLLANQNSFVNKTGLVAKHVSWSHFVTYFFTSFSGFSGRSLECTGLLTLVRFFIMLKFIASLSGL